MGIDDFKHDDEANSDGVVSDGQEKVNSSEARDNSSESEAIQKGNEVILSEEIINFLADLKLNNNRQAISQILESNKQLRDGLKAYILENNSSESKSKINNLQFRLMRCKTENEIKSVIAENIPGGYKVSNGEIVEPIQIGEKVDGISLENINQADQKTEQVNEKGKNLDIHEELKKTIRERGELMEGHEDVDKKIKGKAELAQQQLPEETRNQLNEKGYDDKFINDYILLRVTLNEVKGSSDFDKNQVEQFEKSVDKLSKLDVILKNLDNACKIPDTSLSSFSTENISQTRTELFNEDIGNESLRKTKDSNMGSKSHQEAYDKIFPEMGEEDVITKYGNLLEGKLKVFWNQYQNNSEIKKKITEFKNNSSLLDEKGNLLPYKKIEEKNLDLADDDKILLKNYDIMRSAINEIKENTDKKTKDMMEEMCIISQIKGMYMCMGEGDDFNLNKAKEIESENGILTLKGHIDGVDFAIRQDTNNPEARLQTSQKLAKLADGNMFSVGGKDNFVDSNFILPTQSDIFKLAVESVNSDGALEDADTPAKYVQLTQERFMGRVDNMYEDTKYVHHYMKEQVKGEKIVNDTLGLIGKINPYIINNTALMENITQESNKDLYNFMKILKFNIDNSTDLEKDHFNWCISKIEEIINNYKTNKKISEIYPSEISKYLENDTWTEGTQEERIKLIFDLFNHFNENPIDKSRVGYEGSDRVPINIIINDLYTQLHDKPKQKQEEQQEQQNKEKETDVVYANLMAEYEKNESIA